MKWTPRRLRLALRLYPPYVGAGVKVTRIDPDWHELQVSMQLRWYNRNVVGTHFGGSLYSMVDPHLTLLLMQLLGDEYVVCDKAARIEFKRPGRGRVHCVVRVSAERVAAIRGETTDGAATEPEFVLEIVDDAGAEVATVTKVVHVRRRTDRSWDPAS